MPNTQSHFDRLRRWLALEAEAEAEKTLRDLQRLSPAAAEAAGHSLIQLALRDEGSGLGGRILLTFGKRNQTLSLPWTRLRVGAPVLLTENDNNNENWRGVVSDLRRDSIQVAFPNWPEWETDHPTFRLDYASDDLTRQRQLQALERAQAVTDTRLAELREVLLGTRPADFKSAPPFTPLNSNLNESQRDAVQFALGAADLAIIHGPPGTGKTTTVVEFIRQIVARGETVLACAPSNPAVDNLLEKLVASGANALRLGHPARVSAALREHTLDERVKAHPDLRLAEKFIREARALRLQASKHTRARPEPGARQALRREAKQLIAEARQIEDQLVERLLNASPILCATLTGLDRELLGSRVFDWCVIDEASQSVEPSAWIPLPYARRIVLAGDHCQLPPTVISIEAAAQGFSLSLMERLMRDLGPSHARQLTTQYRMHQDIMAFASQEFYAGSLVAHPSVSAHRLCDLSGVIADELTETPVLYVDTAGANYDEEQADDSESRFNSAEADWVIRQVEKLRAAGLGPAAIAVITPYAAQARLLRERLAEPELEVDTVDGFQGREKEAVIVSLVRSNRDNEIGFLSDVRRINVALTRARRKLMVIGDSATITVHPFYQRLVNYFEAIGAYRSIWEEGNG